MYGDTVDRGMKTVGCGSRQQIAWRQLVGNGLEQCAFSSLFCLVDLNFSC